MIQATELRIGNYLTYHTPDDTDMPCKIDAQDILNISTNYMHNAEIHSPIPLTEEILLKCGFVKNELGDIILNGLMLAHITSDDNFQFEYTSPIMEWKIIDLKYLHQLQNLIHALTNTELNNITL